MQTKNDTDQKSIRCYPTVPKDGGMPNFLVKVTAEGGIFSRIFWMSHEGKFLKPAIEKIWVEWPKSCNSNPVEQDLPKKLTHSAIKIFGQIGAAIEAGQSVLVFIEKEEAEKLKHETVNTNDWFKETLAMYEQDRFEKKMSEKNYYFKKMKQLIEDFKPPIKHRLNPVVKMPEKTERILTIDKHIKTFNSMST